MMRLLCLLVPLFVSPFLLLTGSAHAQQEDTTDAPPAAVDTTRLPSPDTAATDTTQAQVAPDSLAASDTLSADSMAVDSVAADTALSAEAQRERAQEQAQKAAEAWLSLIDDGAFGTSWDEAAVSLQNDVSRAAWQERGAQARATLDSLTRRELTRVEYRDSTTQIPGDAPVVALQYSTAFAAQGALEAVITTKADTTWKVAGYRVVQAPADSVVAPPDSLQAPGDSLHSQPDSTRPPDSTQSPEPRRPENQPEPDSTQGR